MFTSHKHLIFTHVIKGGSDTNGLQKIVFYFLFFNYSCTSKEAEFQVLESYVASFPSYDFFVRLYHCFSFIELTRNEEEAQCFTFSLFATTVGHCTLVGC